MSVSKRLRFIAIRYGHKSRKLVNIMLDRHLGGTLLDRYPTLAELDDDLTDYVRAGPNVFLTPKYCIKSSRPDAGFLIENERLILEKLAPHPCFPNVVASPDDGVARLLVTTRLPGRELATTYRLSTAQRQVFERDSDLIVEALRREGIRHRDITPRNLRLSDDHLFLFDFEFATLNDQELQADSSAGAAYLESSLALLGGRWRSESDRVSFGLVREELSQRYTPRGLLKFTLRRIYRRLGV